MGRGSVIGQALVDHPGVDAISFTGSVGTGRRVAEAALKRMAKMQLEMGGKNPLVVLDDADLEQAVEVTVQGSYSTGQRCTASSRIIVTAGIHDAFVKRLADRTKSLVVGDARRRRRSGRWSTSGSSSRTSGYIALGKDEGARLAAGGQRLKRDTDGFYLAPALFTECSNAMRICREEIFGPVAAVVRAKDYDEGARARERHAVRLDRGHLRPRSSTRRTSSATPRRMLMVNVPTAGVDYRALRRAQRLELRAARAGAVRGGVLHDRQDDVHAGMTA